MALTQYPIVKRGPEKGKRPLCMFCGKELTPRYDTFWKSDGTHFQWREDKARREAGDEPVRKWTGAWNGFPYQIARPYGPIPTHCNVQCASNHGAKLARMLIESEAHGVQLADVGIHRATHCRPTKLEEMANDLLATTPDEE